jgi:hypothetical protein
MKKFTIKENKHKDFLSEERKDPVTGDSFREGDEIVFCKSCGSAFLYTSWLYMGGKHCGQTEVFAEFPEIQSKMSLAVNSRLLTKIPIKISLLTANILSSAFTVFVLIAVFYFFETSFSVIISASAFFAFRNAFLNASFGRSWEMRSNGIFRRNIFDRIFPSQAKPLIKQTDTAQILVIITLENIGGTENGRRLESWIVSKTGAAYLFEKSFLTDFGNTESSGLSAKIQEIASYYPLTILTQVWHEGFELSKKITQTTRYSIKINDLQQIAPLQEQGVDLRSTFSDFRKIYYTDTHCFLHYGSLVNYMDWRVPNEEEDVLTVSSSGLWRNKARKSVESLRIKKVIFVPRTDGFRVNVLTTKSEDMEEFYIFRSYSASLKGIKEAAYTGLKAFCEDNGVPFDFHADTYMGRGEEMFWQNLRERGRDY